MLQAGYSAVYSSALDMKAGDTVTSECLDSDTKYTSDDGVSMYNSGLFCV